MIWSKTENDIIGKHVSSSNPPMLCFVELHEYWKNNSVAERSYDSVQRKMYRMREAMSLHAVVPVAPPATLGEAPPEGASPALAGVVPVAVPATLETSHALVTSERLDIINALQDDYLEEACIYSQLGLEASRKILSLSDIHFPIARTDLIEQIIHQHKDADVLVLNGDLFDGYAFSSFKKDKKINALIEYNAVLTFVHLCSDIFPKVILVDGNHDVRSHRYLRDLNVSDEARDILRPNLMARIANGEVLNERGDVTDLLKFDNVYYDTRESWYVKIGKTIFAHPSSKDKGLPGSTAYRVAQYFSNRYEAGEVDSIVVGHTHKFYKGIVGRQLLVEQGCLSGLAMYSHDPSLQYINTAVNGYAVVYQDDEGNTLFNESGPIYCGHVLPPKKSVI